MTKLTLHVQFERECLSYKYCKLPRVVNLGLHDVLLGKQSLLKRFGKRMRICSDSDPQLRMQTSRLSVWFKNHQLFSATFFRDHPCFSCSSLLFMFQFRCEGRSLVNNRLCMSRSIGDLELKDQGVTPMPDIKQGVNFVIDWWMDDWLMYVSWYYSPAPHQYGGGG